MKLYFSLAMVIITGTGFSQTPHFTKYEIGNSGCAAYFPAAPVFDMAYSDDSSEVFTSEVFVDNANFGIICVRFRDPIGNDKNINTELLISYLDYLKSTLEIAEATGYGKGHTMDDHPDATGVIDYWQAKDKTEYQVKAWVENRFLAVLYVAGSASSENISDLFLNGFRLPAD